MEDRNLSKDEDVESDGGTLHWQTFKFSDCHTAMEDDRQLSSDLERQLKLTTESLVGGEMLARGPEEKLTLKTENRSQPCMFGGFQGATQGGVSSFVVSSAYNPPSYPGTYQQSPLAHPHSYNVTWGQPADQSWRQDDSMSSNDLEMDKEPSITPFSQVTSPPNIQEYSKGGFLGLIGCQGDLAQGFGQKKYVHEDNLRRYDGEAGCSLSNHQHQIWQQNIHLQQSAPSPVTMATTDDVMVPDEKYTFELDEFGEGPLHTLSAVTDKKTLARSIELLQKCDVVTQCINLQNKLKQTPLFLSVLQRNIPLIGWLLDHGADPNIQGTLYTDRDEYIWRSPLHLAAMKGDEWLCIVRLLLSKTLTDINLFSHGDKLSALHVAMKHHKETNSCRQVILELISKGADINLREQASSKTPFMLLLETRDLDLVQEFLNKFPADRRRAILQEQARSGDTCLHIAAGLSRINSQDKEKLLRYLVTHGANGNITNNVKELPRDFARKEWDNIRKT